ncbi:MAG TPA: DUF1318 domain-containing protein [Polyangia bacterium]|nr:DUF1318 domain-containing protein [Polyangia bacterium]
MKSLNACSKFLLAAGALAAAAAGGGCIKAPDIVLVDRATALEQQAAGSYASLEAELTSAGMAPRPTPFARGQLEAAGIKPPTLADEAELGDADRVDALLKQRCIGEALDGTLVDTHDVCGVADDLETNIALVDRSNRDRGQIWKFLQTQRPKASPDDVRRVWRETHLKSVVCGGWVERVAGEWEAKKC